MPTTITLMLAVLGLFIWLAVLWRRSQAAARELHEARRAFGIAVAELQAARAEILELQIRVDRLDGGGDDYQG